MKKFLSLVLALVMTMSLVTVSAGAKDFNDAEDIQYTEAVEVLNMIGVLEGYPDGSFQPKTVLTRAQAATIIAKLLLTPEVAAELSADAAPFADVPADNWAAAYIAEGVQGGILSGMGDGTFAPNAQLTGFQYLKMLLCALGYDAAAEGMTGANWSINVAKLAKANDLTEGNDKFVGKNPVTREEAALYTFNAMKVKEYTYENEGGMSITVGDVVITNVGGNADNKYGDTLIDTYGLEKETDGEDDFGRAGIYWTYEDEETAIVYEAADYVLVAEKTYEADEDATALEQLIEDNELEDEIVAGTTQSKKIAIGTVIELWLDDDDEIVDYITYTYDMTTVTSVEDDIDDEDHLYEVGVSAVYELEDLDEYTYVDAFEKCDDKKCKTCKTLCAIGDWEEDDVILLTINMKGEAVEFAEIDTVEGEISSKKAGYIKIDGEKIFTELSVDFDKEYTFYLDANGIAFAKVDGKVTKGEDEDKEYVYVLKAQAEDGTEGDLFADAEDAAAKVKVMYVDGEVEVLDYCLYENDDEEMVFELNGKEVDFSAEDFEDAIEAGWYSYEIHDDMICLTEEDAETIKVSDARSWAGGLRANADTELVLLDKDGVYKTYTGRADMPEMELTNALIVLDGKTVVAVYNYTKAYEDEAETIDVAMFVELGEETADGVEAIFYVAGEKETYVVADADALTDAGLLFEVEIDEDDIATVTALSEEREDIVAGEVTFVDGEYFEIGDDDFEMTDDCAVYQVNKSGEKVSDGTLTKGENVVVILNSDGDAVEIFQYKNEILAWAVAEAE